MISPGAIVRVFKHGDIAWVVRDKLWDGRWRVVAKAVDQRGRGEILSSRVVGEGDTVLVRDPPTYQVGTEVKHEGVKLTVLEDRGDHVLFSVPATRFPLKGGDHLHVAAGNHTEIDKATLVLASL